MKTISTNQRLQLIGLLTLAGQHTKMLESISKSALEITGEEDELSHTRDAIYDDGSRDADALLELLEIKVRK